MSRTEAQPSFSRPAVDAPQEQQRRSLRPIVVPGALALLVAGYGLFFGWLSLRRYWAFEMHALDMGNMGQAAWNTVHRHPFFFTNMRLQYWIEAWHTTTRLSFHVEALFPVISLVYLIYPHPESLLVLQTAALSLGAVPVYLLARDELHSRALGLVFAVSYLLFPSLQAMNLYEFHPVALATPLLLFAFLFARRRQYVLFVLCCIAAMGTKEEIGLIVALFGLYMAAVQREWKVGIAAAVGGTLWSLVAVLVIERHYRVPPTRTYLQTRYGYLGHGLHGALHTVLHDPAAVFHVLFVWPKLGYLIRLLAPTGFTALLDPLALLLGSPTFALNLFSSDFHMYSGVGDNSAELIAVVLIAGVLGAGRLLRWLGAALGRTRAVVALCAYILAVALWSQHASGYTPLGAMYQVAEVGGHQRLANSFLALIPGSVPVSTQDQLDPHLSSRHYLYLFRDTGRDSPPLAPADYILLDVAAPTYPLPSYQLHDVAQSWIHRPGWGVAAADDGLILIAKGAKSRSIPARFYQFARADLRSPDHPLSGGERGMELIGYDVKHTDLPNHYVPNLAYTLYLRPLRQVNRNLQPVVYEVMNGSLMGCAHGPLGLAWFPTSRWMPDHTYAVHMDTIETEWNTPGTAHLYAELVPVSQLSQAGDCGSLWRRRGRLWPVGTLVVRFW